MFQNFRAQPPVEQLPPHFFSTTRTRDTESHGRSITGWTGRYEHVGREAFKGEVIELRLWPIQIFIEHLDQPCIWRGAPWSGALVFMSIGALQGNLSFDGRAVEPSAVTLLPANSFVNNSFNNAPVDSVAVAVKEAALAAFAEQALGRSIPLDSLRQCLTITAPEAVEAYQDGVARIVREVSDRPALINDERFCVQARERLLNMLVGMLAAHLDGAQQLGAPSTRGYIVEKAIRYIDSRVADAFEMADLCEAIRVCARTLRYSFQEVMGVSPTQYLLATRLGRVRRALLQASPASQVQFIAAQFGFAHMGRFARYYIDTYGERPSDTLRRNAGQRAANG